MSGRRLILLRHGRTAYNASRRFQGQLDQPLDDLGIAQAAAAAQVLAPMRPAALISSDLVRAAATAAPLAEATGLPLVQDPRLREIHLGEWQGLSIAEAGERFPAELAAWREGEDVRRGGGETYYEVGARAVECVQESLAPLGEGELLVAVTHGGTARAIVGTLIGMHHDRWSALGPLGNCRFSFLVEAGARGWRLLMHNAGTLEVEGLH
ncbi:MAG TPA: histidine phosphatase family protein [Mycobacteriales bacterium]|nr:histidine phosphatase family protein [Mycobacteriales bacterium]